MSLPAPSMPSLGREAALRIALAARILPGIELGQLVELLHQRISGDIDEDSLKLVTVTDLKTAFSSLDGEEDGEDIGIGLDEMKEAVRILWGEDWEANVPKPHALEQPFENAIRVAIASNSGETLNGHFGSCIRYLIYQMNNSQYQLIDVRSALQADFEADKNGYRTNLIKDCQVLYVVSVGGPAAAKVVRAGIYPIKQIEGGEADKILSRLQAVMKGSPPPWLAKIMGASAKDRIRYKHKEALSI